MSKIIVKYINPPIPVRFMDYIAHLENDEEGKIVGYGSTKKEAIEDLLGWLDEDQIPPEFNDYFSKNFNDLLA
ncbi:MAG TPA: hypothetical protein VKR58_10870 [Aquella sp.]|nr:hypothetical protein [Aquella sp.]